MYPDKNQFHVIIFPHIQLTLPQEPHVNEVLDKEKLFASINTEGTNRVNFMIHAHGNGGKLLVDVNNDTESEIRKHPSELIDEARENLLLKDRPIFLDLYSCCVGVGIKSEENATKNSSLENEHRDSNIKSYSKLSANSFVILNGGNKPTSSNLNKYLTYQAINKKYHEMSIPEIFLNKILGSPNTTKLVHSNQNQEVSNYVYSMIKPTSKEDVALDKIKLHLQNECEKFVTLWNQKNPDQSLDEEKLKKILSVTNDQNFLTEYGNQSLFCEAEKTKLPYVKHYVESKLFNINYLLEICL